MKRALTYFFVAMGIIFTLILIGLAYLWFFDPLGLRLLLQPHTEPSNVISTTTTEVGATPETTPARETTDQNPSLTPAQEDALSLIGIDPAGLPETLTTEQNACFIRIFGAERVNEIIGGETPTPLELLQGKQCL